ncbi:Di-copper centre-containing protein [Didymella exigua CBS 183.55]|uniref:Di-copper centre-containing protein n=1 Tax=Didymella exigua CBS 183.55 TaxID=1150837 RepID=A0A6A5RGT9_9PLEO|nr:Di-copper centre-containing protein [Didymella exigua CBS 183.55]KAF1926703.1 Di-copper centre-containing protein [Didymella exigua CBS 183.55]
MHLLLTSAALAVSCNAFALPWTTRAVDATLPALPLSNFETPKYARLLELDEALSGIAESLTTSLTTSLKVELGKFAKRQSTCSNVRTRVEWDHASDSQRQGYVDAIKCLMQQPPSGQFSASKSRYDDLVGLHQTLTPRVHGNAKFLLWHRYYTWTYESLLREQCGLTGPLLWFDETRYAGNYAASSIFSSQWFGSINLGGNCVTDGQFANLALVYGPGTSNTPHCLARNNDDSKTINTGNAIVDACNSRSDYADMAACAEGGAHAWGHNGIGAVMADVYASPSDPVFFLHHAFIDRNLRIWQNNGGNARVSSIDGTDASGNALTLDTKINVYGFRPDVTIGDILDTKGSTLCYKYDY